MFYAFILESIGTSELMLIGLVALIVFGPRKLPELARTIGKTMAEFRRSTDDFKKTWQQELDLEEVKKSLEVLTDFRDESDVKNENPISRSKSSFTDEVRKLDAPEIKEMSENDLENNFPAITKEKSDKSESVEKISEKRNWL